MTGLGRATRLVIAAAAAALALRAITFSLADLSALSRPNAALFLDRGQATAREAVAAAALDESDEEAARAHARVGLRAAPLARGLYSVLAQIAEGDGNEAQAGELWRLAGRWAREPLVQAELFERAGASGDYDEAARRLDLLFRSRGGAGGGAIVKALLPMLADADLRRALARKLREDPPWRVGLLNEIAARGDVDVAHQMFAEIEQDGGALTMDERRAILRRLAAEKRWGEAFAGFVRVLATGGEQGPGYLYNADFRRGVSHLPFDWEIESPPNALVDVQREGRRQVLRISFFGGRVPFQHVRHLLALPPGRYRFAGEEMAIGLANERGLRWRIFCLDDAGETLATTPPISGDAGWRPFAVEFDVPDACLFQALRLELPWRVALEQVVRGDVAFAALDLQPVASMSQK